MPNKSKLRKLFVALGIKGVICLICLTSISFALVTYTNVVTITPTVQLTNGASTATWTIYVNQVAQVQYTPGGSSEPTLNTGNTNTYAFKVVTDANKVCAVKVEITTPVDEAKFSQFDITVLSSTTGTWGEETLYAGSTGTTTTASINGLTPEASAYIHQDISTTKYYVIQVTYSYDLVDENTQIPVTFVFTPLPLSGF